MTAATPVGSSSNRWLFGPFPDLMLGCGLLYGVVFATLAVGGPELIKMMPSSVPALLIMVFVMPHYGGTLLRVYEQRADRRAYTIFSVWATLAVFALFVVGIHSAYVGAIMVTVYLTWSPWHYTGQNYGLAVMFLRRRGVSVEPAVKRWLYASFILSYVLTFVAMHISSGAGYDALAYEGSEILFLPLGIPRTAAVYLMPVVGTAYLIATGGAVIQMLRRGSLRDVAPTLALMVTQTLWFSAPITVRFYEWTTGLAPLDAQMQIRDYALFVFLGHGIQYLWVTTYYARNSRSWTGYGRYLLKAALTGISIWTLPFMVFGPDALGKLSFDAGMALVVASAVNIHHFILDGAIWKLRSSRVASVLIRSEKESAASAEPRPTWRRPALWALCSLGLAVGVFEWYEARVDFQRAYRAGDVDRAERVLDRLAWIGYDRGSRRRQLGQAYAKQGELDIAEDQFARSVKLRPDAAGFIELGKVQQRRGELEDAARSYAAALARDPSRPDKIHALLGGVNRELGRSEAAVAHLRDALQLNPRSGRLANDLAWVLATTPNLSLRSPEEAIRLSEAVLRTMDRPDPNALDTLAAGYAAAGRFDDAVRTASRAVALANASGNDSLSNKIRRNLAQYREGRAVLDPPDGAQAQ